MGVPLRLIAIGAAAFVSAEASAQELCGRSFDTFNKLYVDLAKERTHQMRGGGPNDAMFIDGQGTTWLFTRESHPAFPAVACVRRIQKGQQFEIERHVWCRGGACDAFIARIPAVNDFTSGPFERR